MAIDHLRTPADKLTNRCDPESLGFETTKTVTPLEGTIGQDRAVSALELGLNVEDRGFNLFLSGAPGSGRNTALKAFVDNVARSKPVPPDWGYVHNFQDPSQPVAISLPCGMLRELARDVDELVVGCRQELPKAFESDDYRDRVEEVMKDIQAHRERLGKEMEQAAEAQGFAVRATQAGITPVPMTEGRAMTPDEFNALPEDRLKQLREQADKVQSAIANFMTAIRKLNKEATERAREVDKEIVRYTLKPIIDELQEKYAAHDVVVNYLDSIEEDMIEHLDVFKSGTEEAQQVQLMGMPFAREDDFFIRYRVNDLVDNSVCEGAPVIVEYNPTYYNLFGRIDYRATMGAMQTDLTMIKSGALHRANGGYLILQARDLLTSPLSWDTLKRTMRSGHVRIENMGEQYMMVPTATLRPEPIPVRVKIVIVGTPDILRALQWWDEDFQRYFKIMAEFDTVMDRTPENIQQYASFIAARCEQDNLKPFDKTAVAHIIEHSSRLVDHQQKLSARFMEIADLVTESAYWANHDGNGVVTEKHVKKAVDQRRYRSNLTEERLREMIEEGKIHISTAGKAIGKVNGLAVLSLGTYAFGRPSRVTARASLGRGQLVNIERESRLSGRIHDKGFTILTGYMQGKYGQHQPLSLNASIGFEQSYSEIDGDSASSTELYALLSELSGLEISQSIAVTGSVNQYGEVQAIGGATEKVEGFFDLCVAMGLTGDQGVMLPKDNLKHVMLKDEVIEAVEAGKFHVYGVSTIDEGIEILTGMPAGVQQEDGAYPEGTVHHLVELRLKDMADKLREFGRQTDANGKKDATPAAEPKDEPTPPNPDVPENS